MRQIIMNLNDTDKNLYFKNNLRQGENFGTELIIKLNTEFAGYRYLLVFQNNNNLPVYTEELFAVNGIVEYPVSGPIIAEAGELKVEFQAFEEITVDNKRVIKSAITTLKVQESLNGQAEIVNTPYNPWYTEALDAAASALASKNAAATSATNSAGSASSALASKNAAATSETNAATSASSALTSKNAAATSASEALASKNAAAQSAIDAETLAASVETHKAEAMPHLATDTSNSKKYKFGLQLSADGNPQIIFEEVV